MQVDDLLGAIWLPGDGKVNPTDLTQSLAKGARQGGATDPRAGAGDRLRGRRRPTAAGHRRAHRPGRRRVPRWSSTAPGQWAQGARRPGSASTVPLHSAEHFYVVTEAVDGHPPGPADHARPGRLDVLQGGGRRPGRRRLRAGGQAVALAGRPAVPLRVPAARGGLGALLGADGRGAAADPGAGRDRDPEVLQRAGVVHARQPVPARRGARARRRASSAPASTRSASPPPAAPGGRSPSGSSAGEPPDDLVGVDVRRFAPFHARPVVLRDRVAEVLGPALRGAVAEPRGPRPPATCGSRPLHDRLAAAGARVRLADGLGAAERLRPRRARPSSTPGASRPGCPGRRPSSGPPGPTSRSSTRRRSRSTSSPGPDALAGAAVGLRRRRRRRRSAAASTRRSSTSAAPTRPT